MAAMNRFDGRPLYGRKDEIARLQGIVASVLRGGDFVIDPPSSTLLSKRHDCLRDCNCSEPTESTSHSGEENPSNSCTTCFHEKIITSQWRDSVGDGGVGGSRCHFVLVSGPPGAGKRTLVTTALRRCKSCERECPFLLVSGRFPSRKEDSENTLQKIPFATITEAIQDIALTLAQQSADLRVAIREKLRVLLRNPEDASALCELIPELKTWLLEGDVDDPDAVDSVLDHESVTPFSSELRSYGAPPTIPKIQSAVHHLQVWFPVLQTFLHAVATCVPVLFILEDLHHADETSLSWIKSLLWTNKSATEYQSTDIAAQGLIIIATYTEIDGATSSSSLVSSLESSDTDSNRPFAHTPEKDEFVSKPPVSVPISDSPDYTHQIAVSDLSWDVVSEWVHACGGFIEQCSDQQKIDIVNLVFHHSHGNPLHIRYILLYLENDETLLQQPIHKKRIPNNIDDLFKCIYERQNDSVHEVVEVIALLAQYYDGEIHQDILEIAMGSPCMDLAETACWFGLIEYSSTRPIFSFYRESFQTAVFNTIVDVAPICLDVGRRIWRNAILAQDSMDSLDSYVIARVLLATQLLHNSLALLPDIAERIYMSQLCYGAGQKSSSLGDFHTASKLFEFAICVLRSELWRSDLYDASLLLHNGAAEAYCNIVDYANMKRVLDAIFDNAENFQDKLPAYLILVYSSGSGHKLIETLRISSMVLRELGEPVSEHPGSITIMTYLLRVKWALRSKTDLYLRNLPNAEDADYLVVMQLLTFSQFIGFMTHPERSLVIILRLVLSALKHGICGPSAMAFSSLAYVLSGTGDFDEGHRLGQLALHYATRFGAWWPRIHVLFHCYISHWTFPIRDSLKPLERVQQAALLFGDLEIHALSSVQYLLSALNNGELLSVLEPKSRAVCLDLAAIGQTNQLLLALQIWSLVNDLQGGTNKLGLSGNIHDASSALKHCIKEGNKFVSGNSYIFHVVWYYLIGDYEQSLQNAVKAASLLVLTEYLLTFYEGLSTLAIAWNSKLLLRRRYLGRGVKVARCFKRWADRCPENFRNKQWLLEAEIAALKGNSIKALALFEQSIEKARHESFIQEEAIAYERLGHYQRRVGNISDAVNSFRGARSLYEKWGASVLMGRMDDMLISI